jgi:polygalacturonase
MYLATVVVPQLAHAGEWKCTAVCDRHGGNTTAPQTACLQSAMDECRAKAPASEIAVLVLPAGVYHTGSLVIPTRTTVRLQAGATLLGSLDPEDYPLVGALQGYGVPRDCCCNDWLKYNCRYQCPSYASLAPAVSASLLGCSPAALIKTNCNRLNQREHRRSGKGLGVPPSYTMRYRSLLTTKPHSTDVAIEGAGPSLSKIDGNGWLWWSRFEHLGLAAGRPHLVEPLFVRRFRIEDVHLQDSPFWSLHPYACDDVVIRGLHITADPVRGHNTDGVDPVRYL